MSLLNPLVSDMFLFVCIISYHFTRQIERETAGGCWFTEETLTVFTLQTRRPFPETHWGCVFLPSCATVDVSRRISVKAFVYIKDKCIPTDTSSMRRRAAALENIDFNPLLCLLYPLDSDMPKEKEHTFCTLILLTSALPKVFSFYMHPAKCRPAFKPQMKHN